MVYTGDDFYCDEALSGRTPVTNIGAYQDSKHLHIHVSAGEQLR